MLTEIEKLYFILGEIGYPEDRLPEKGFLDNKYYQDDNVEINIIDGTVTQIVIQGDAGKEENKIVLKGTIPEMITELTDLRSLWFSETKYLTGEIPKGIGNLTKLEQLVLKDNQLTGEIPSSITELNKGNILDRLDLSLNCLELEKASATRSYLQYLYLGHFKGDVNQMSLIYNNFTDPILNSYGPNPACAKGSTPILGDSLEESPSETKKNPKYRICYNSRTGCFNISH
jgi:Leucine-rich repeat (LRR) protein